MTASSTLVIALGGNAISPPGAVGTIEEQFATTRRTAEHLVELVARGHRLVLTHGNGPQVGNVLRRVEIASSEVYSLPLDVCVADTQGGMGYMIAVCLENALAQRGITRAVVPIVTTVEVDADDPAFGAPTKPVGAFYSAQRARELQEKCGYAMVAVPGRGLRRVVPSPRPRAIVAIDAIRRWVEAGELLVVAGGGGVPVVQRGGQRVGCEAVIDKDLTSSLLALGIGADVLVLATGVERVALDFGRPGQRDLDRLSVADARRYLAAGQFPPGSMAPKIEAAIAFVAGARGRPARAVICGTERIAAAVAGESGTEIVN